MDLMVCRARRVAFSAGVGLGLLLAVCAAAIAQPAANDSATAAFEHGVALTEDGKFEAAIKEFDEAIRIRPGYPQAYNARGEAYDNLHQEIRAEADYDQAVALDPSFADALFNLGRTRGRHGGYVEAVAYLDQAIKLKPDMQVAFKERGFNHYRMKSYLLALQDLQEALKLKPDDPDAYSSRAIVRHAMGEDRLAFDDFDRALKLKPDFAGAYDDRGTVYNELERYERAVRDFDQAIKLQPDLVFSYFNRAVAYAKLGMTDLAIADYGQVMKLRPTYVTALANRAAIYRDRGQVQLALADLNQAIEVNPRFANALRDRARLYKENNRPDLAISDFSRARDAYDIGVSIRPDDLDLLRSRADAAYEARRWRDTVTDYSKVIERDPKMALAYERRAEAYTDTGDFAAGLADTETALKLDRRSRNAKYFRAYLNRALGNYDAALKDYDGLAGSEDDGTAYLQRGIVYFCMGKYGEAETDFRGYLASHSNDVWTHNWVHVVRAKRGLADDPAYAALSSSPLDRLARYEIANMFRGKTPFEEVSARMLASRSDPLQKANWPCSSGFFLGEYKLEHGDLAEAKTYLREVAADSNCTSGVVAAAAAELKRLPAN